MRSKTFRKGGIMGLFKGKETYKEELAEGKAIKSGKISPEQYAKAEGKEKKFAMGGYMGGATFPNQQFPMQQQAPQNTMLNAPATPGMPYAANNQTAFKKGGAVKKMAPGGMSTARIGEDVDGGSAGRGNNGLPSMTQEAISEMAQEAANRKKAPAKPKAVKKTREQTWLNSLTPEQVNRANQRDAIEDIEYRGPAPVLGQPYRGLTWEGMPSPYTAPMKKGGRVKKMAMGGPMDPRMAMMAKKKAPRGVAPARGMMPPAAAPRGMMSPAAPQVAPTMPMKKGGKVKGQSPIQTKAKGGAKIVKMAKGGLTSSRGDGCAIRGKTRA